MATHSSTLAWKIPWTEEPARLQSMGSLRVGYTERLHFHFSLACVGEGNGSPLQCSCLENPRDRRASWAAIYGVAQSRTRLKPLSSSSSSSDVLQWPLLTEMKANWCLRCDLREPRDCSSLPSTAPFLGSAKTNLRKPLLENSHGDTPYLSLLYPSNHSCPMLWQPVVTAQSTSNFSPSLVFPARSDG